MNTILGKTFYFSIKDLEWHRTDIEKIFGPQGELRLWPRKEAKVIPHNKRSQRLMENKESDSL